MLEQATGTASFFQAMAPVLIANVLTAALRLLLCQNLPEGAKGRGRATHHLFVAEPPRRAVLAVQYRRFFWASLREEFLSN